METNTLFTAALELADTPWKVTGSKFEGSPPKLELDLDFERGSRFPCPQCVEAGRAEPEALCPVHDTTTKQWRHMDFFQYQCLLSARVPRVKCAEHGVLQADVPWARSGSGFTLLMEAGIMELSNQMPMAAVARQLGVHDTRLWRVILHHVNLAQAARDWSKVTRVLVDETSSRRGHRYVTNFVCADSRELLFMTEGRKAEAFEAFAQALADHGVEREQITWVCMDMSRSYRKGAREVFPGAKIVFDRFHVMQLAGKAVDEVRKELARHGVDLKGAMWALRGNEWNLSEDKRLLRNQLARRYKALGRALMLRDVLADILATGTEADLRAWCTRMLRSRLEPFRDLVATLREHWDGVVAMLQTDLTNGLVEAINGQLQLAKRMARGFRGIEAFRAMAYLKAAKLKLTLPPLKPT
jgi:transposase